MIIHDISRDILTSKVYEGDPQTEVNRIKSIENGDDYNLSAISMSTHTGTHIDAPLHFSSDGSSISKMRLNTFTGKCTVVTVNGILTGEDMDKILAHSRKKLLLHGNCKAFVSAFAARVLADSDVVMIGTDAQSIAPEYDENETHKILANAGIAILENLDLSDIADGDYELFAFPIKLGGLEAAPCRAILFEQERGIATNEGLKQAGLPVHPMEKYNHFVGNGREMLVKRAMGEKSEDKALFDKVMNGFNTYYGAHSNDHTAEYKGCTELLEQLDKNGIMTAVLSNKPDEFVGAILAKVFPNHKFTEAWGNKKEYKCKPDGEALNAILSKHNVKQSECIYIGDSDVDVFTAKNAGVSMLGVEWGFRGRKELTEAGAPQVAATADELLNMILAQK